MNCVNGPTSAPCGTCQSCVDLAPNGPGSIDVIEIDAASVTEPPRSNEVLLTWVEIVDVGAETAKLSLAPLSFATGIIEPELVNTA